MLKKPRDLYLSSFRIIRRDLMDEILKYGGPFPYIDGLILRSTSKIAKVEVEHHPRAQGESNYTFIKLVRLWSYMFLNFSTYPLRVASLLGFVFAFLGLLGSFFVIIEKLLYPETQVGWSSLIVTLFVLSGVQLIILGLMGEYVGRTFITQSKCPAFTIFEKKDERNA
jgi:undecaprenyl-phosphate 4-deoxy-4-formamido-L-arabinose transferase